jgi:3-hydroxyisobutyrate dehydrogenase-like beta-hydroxyacid dehydrogenase
MKLAFLGLGVMGFPMAGHLAQAGHAVTVYNRTASKAERWLQSYPGSTATSPRAAAKDAELVFACVGNDADVAEITQGEAGAFAGMRPGSLFVDHSSISANGTQTLAQTARKLGLDFIDAPVSGGQAGAEQGKLSIMCGGDAAAYARAVPVMQSYARQVQRIGESGSGQLAKMVNQICIAGLLQGLAEALAFGQQAQLDMARVLEVISKGAAQSWQMENRSETMLRGEFDFGFAVDWMRKDLANVAEAAKGLGLELTVTTLVDQYYAELQAQGAGRLDTSSLIKRLV